MSRRRTARVFPTRKNGKQSNRINIIIDDTRITEERLQELLQEISESGCLVANTDSNIHMPALGTDQQVLYFQALGNIMNREDRCLTELFLIVKDYGLEAKWNEIAEAFGDDNDLEKRINSFLTTIPYPSEAHISVQAVTLALQTIFRTNSLEGKELSMLSAETEGLIKKFDVIGISEKDFNKLIKAAAGSKRKANIQDVYDIEERLDDSISYYDRIKEGCSAISKIVQEAIDKKNEKKNKKSFGDVIKDVVPDKAEKIFDGFAKLGKKDSLELPPEYVELKQKLPEDLGVPKDAVGYGMRTEAASAMLISYPVTEKESMPFGDAQWIIDEMHRIMGDNEGLIEVKTGETDKGCPYSYDIIKHRFEYEEGGPAYVEYTININVKQEKEIQFINGSFKEEGITGARESQTMMMVAQANDMSLEEVANNWCEDPYDPDYKKGFLMNRAEKEELDEAFPWHALSEARNLLRYIIENN